MPGQAIHVVDLIRHPPPDEVSAEQVWLVQAPNVGELPPGHRVLEGAYDRTLSRQWYELLAAPQVRDEGRSAASPQAIHRALGFWAPANRHAVELARELARVRPDSMTFTTDHQAGRELARLVRQTTSSLGIGRVESRDLVALSGTAGRLGAGLENLKARFRHAAHLVQNLTYRGRNASLDVDLTRPLVVLYCDSPRNWELLEPVHAEFAHQPADVCVLTTRPPMADQLRAEGVNVLMARSRPHPLLLRSLERHVRAVTKATAVDLEPDLREALVRIALAQYRGILPRVVAARRTVFGLARGGRPICVAHASEGQPTAWSATVAAIDLGLGTALLPHGVKNPGTPIYRYYPKFDAFLVWGEQNAEELRDSELDPGIAIDVVGCPKIERLIEPARNTPIPDPRDGIVLVVFGRPSRSLPPRIYAAAVAQVFDAAAQHPDLRFVVKPHPADTSGYWRTAVSRRPMPNLEICNENFYGLLPRSWLVVTMQSTAGAEALCTGRPVVRVSPRDEDADEERRAQIGWDPFTPAAAYTAEQPGELGQIIGRIEEVAPNDDLRQGRDEFARRFLHVTEVPAATRTATALVGLSRSIESPAAPVRGRSEGVSS